MRIQAHACRSPPPLPSLPQTPRTDSARLASSHAHQRPPRADCGALNGGLPQASRGTSSSRPRKIIAAGPASPAATPTCRIPSRSGIRRASAAHARTGAATRGQDNQYGPHPSSLDNPPTAPTSPYDGACQGRLAADVCAAGGGRRATHLEVLIVVGQLVHAVLQGTHGRHPEGDDEERGDRLVPVAR